jgi:hypothetical protein
MFVIDGLAFLAVETCYAGYWEGMFRRKLGNEMRLITRGRI